MRNAGQEDVAIGVDGLGLRVYPSFLFDDAAFLARSDTVRDGGMGHPLSE